jgi:hypothetical protein
LKATIDVANRQEADAVRRAMQDPTTRAYVIIEGTLAALPSDRARRRVLAMVSDRLDEEHTQVSE